MKTERLNIRLSHSAGDRRPRMKKQSDTLRYAPPKYIQTSAENGDINENVDGGSFTGFLKRIDMPEGNAKKFTKRVSVWRITTTKT